MNKVVRIDPHGNPHSDDHPMHVSRKQKDTIAWTAEGNGGPWEITFTGSSPVGVAGITVAKAGTSTVHSITGEKATYPYTIAAAGSGGGQDPDIIIDD